MALAYAIVSLAAPKGNPLAPLARFQISGDATTPLYPGGPSAPIDLNFTNPNTFPITVSGIAVKVAGTSNPACDISNFSVGSQLPGSLRLPASATTSLSQLGVPSADWPRVAMVSSSSNQDSCKSASVRLAYSGQATGSGQPPGTPVGSATGLVYVNGNLFRHGGIANGAKVLILPGGRLTLGTPTGTITVYPPKGKSVRFIVRRVTVKRPYPLKNVARASAKAKRRAFTELKLTGGELSRCPRKVSPTTAHASASAPERSLWAKGKGPLRVRGRYGIATGRRAWWLTQDRCSGTRVKVKKGTVRVDHRSKRKSVYVKAGHHYLAHPWVNLGLKKKVGQG